MALSERIRENLQMLTLDDVARKLNVPVEQIRILIDNNQLSHYRLGKQGEITRFIQYEVDLYQARQQNSQISGLVVPDSVSSEQETGREC